VHETVPVFLQSYEQGIYYYKEPIQTDILTDHLKITSRLADANPWVWISQAGLSMHIPLPHSSINKCTGFYGESCMPGKDSTGK
jgi:hypothetical protein